MTNDLIALSPRIVNIQYELTKIGANARGLSEEGRKLMPLKPHMLYHLNTFTAATVLQATELLFAAILRFVGAQVDETRALSAVDIVAARLERGEAEGTCHALIYGSTRELFHIATQQAPIAMHSLLTVAPELNLVQRILAGDPNFKVPKEVSKHQKRKIPRRNIP